MSQHAFDLPGTVTSVIRGDNCDVIEAAHQLGWLRDEDRVLDLTYGRGLWWTRWRPPNLVVHEGSFLDLGEGVEGTMDAVTFDPPYVLVGGRATSTVPDFLDRYGLLEVRTDLPGMFRTIGWGLGMAYVALRPGGRLLVKCCNFISSGRFVAGHHQIVADALWRGFEQVDELVHYSGTGPQPLGRRQVHSRRAHSFLCVFAKSLRPAQ